MSNETIEQRLPNSCGFCGKNFAHSIAARKHEEYCTFNPQPPLCRHGIAVYVAGVTCPFGCKEQRNAV